MKHLGPGDFAQGMEFCNWLGGSSSLHCYILYMDEVQFHTDAISNKQLQCVVTQSYHCGSNFQVRFFVIVWCVVMDNEPIGPIVFEGRLTGEAYLLVLQQELPQLVENVPVSKGDRGYFELGGASLHFSLEVRN